ncbi:hypothetical protein BRC83_01470 [Halobacteriales archaeon QS_1_68_17]|nr:MAG: hypothetical protein BRC83_01470 [Halobacteriales archaeon QS_1_68_17]
MPEGDYAEPDDVFRLVAGLYAGVLAGTCTTVWVSVAASADTGTLYLCLLGVTTAVTLVVAWRAGRWRGLPERLGRTRLVVLLPVGLFLSGLGLFVLGFSVAGAVALALLSFVGAIALGLPLVVMSRNRYVDAVVPEGSGAARWKAEWPHRERRVLLWAQGVGLMGGASSILIGAVLDFDLLRIASACLLTAGISAVGLGEPRTYVATPAGLVVGRPGVRRLLLWDWLSGYTHREDAIVIHHQRPWRPDLRCATTDIDDPEAVVAALDRFLSGDGASS